MKRKTLLTLAAAGLLLLTSCGPKLHRYGCNKRRCLVENERTDKKIPVTNEATVKKTKATV